MKTFNQYMSDEISLGTYVCVRFTDESNRKLAQYALELGLTPIDDFHTTVVYSEKPLAVPHGTLPFSDTLTPVSVGYLGPVDSEWRAVVINVSSNGLQGLFDHYVDKLGYEPEFTPLLQHVSLAYKPREDIDYINSVWPNFEIVVDKITIEPLKME
jgi:hypothetical protein